MSATIGIDPGKTGAMAVLEGSVLRIWKFSTWKQMYSILIQVRDEDCTVALEKVHAFKGQGVTSSFSFGASYGGWISILEGLGISYQLIPPQRWQKSILGTGPAGQSKPRALAFAQRYWPQQDFKKSHDGPVDAALLALYLQRLSLGQVHQTDSPPKPKKKRVNSNIEVPASDDLGLE